MITKTVVIENMDGTTEQKTLYFNLTRAELIRMEASEEGGLSAKLKELQTSKNIKEIIAAFEYILGSAYGEKSDDGKKFIKNATLTQAFLASEAYSVIFEEFLAEPANAASFIRSLAPNVDRLLNKTPEQIRAESLAAKGGFNKKQETSTEIETVSGQPDVVHMGVGTSETSVSDEEVAARRAALQAQLDALG